MSIRASFEAISPPWLIDDDENGDPGVSRRLLYALCLIQDMARGLLYEGMLARFPTIGTYTALPLIARDRLYDQGVDEPNATFGERLGGAFDEHATRGNPHTLLRQLRAHFLATDVPYIRVVSDRGVWHEIDMATGDITRTIASPNNWKWDAYAWGETATPRRHRAWIIIDMSNGPWGPAADFGDPDFDLDDGHLFGVTGCTAEQIATLRRLARTWKPKHVHIPKIILTFDSDLFKPGNAPGAPMPDGDYDDPANRSTDAAYIAGVLQ